MNEVDRVAVKLYPQLKRFIELRDSDGWTLQPVTVENKIELVTGWRLWPQGWSDAIAIRNVTDAKAYRCDPAGGEVWGREGTLAEVLEALIELPAPSDPNAPPWSKAVNRPYGHQANEDGQARQRPGHRREGISDAAAEPPEPVPASK